MERPVFWEHSLCWAGKREGWSPRFISIWSQNVLKGVATEKRDMQQEWGGRNKRLAQTRRWRDQAPRTRHGSPALRASEGHLPPWAPSDHLSCGRWTQTWPVPACPGWCWWRWDQLSEAEAAAGLGWCHWWWCRWSSGLPGNGAGLEREQGRVSACLFLVRPGEGLKEETLQDG